MNVAVYYHHLAALLVTYLHTTPELLHVNAGVVLWLASALAIRQPLRSPIPLLIVLAAELANEAMDRLFWGVWHASAGIDIFNTIGWPAAIALALTLAPKLRR